MAIYNLLCRLAMAEEGGFGIWYEYLVKYRRIFKRHLNYKKILVFGLPSKYSLGLDTLSFAENSKLEIVDNRSRILKKYEAISKQFARKIKIFYNASLGIFNPGKRYDLVISTEVIQDNPELLAKMKELGKIIIVFVPNKKCYAHPRISKLNSLSLNELIKLGKKNNLKSIDKGYIDCPPWPAGAKLSKNDKKIKDSLYLKIIKRMLVKLTPFLAKFDNFYPSPWKELNSHMVYCVFENEQI